MKDLSREDILSLNNPTIKPLDIWGGRVYVTVISGVNWERVEALATRNEDGTVHQSQRALIAACCLCDRKGQLLFDIADVSELARKPYNELEKIVELAMDVNHIGSENKEKISKESKATLI